MDKEKEDTPNQNTNLKKIKAKKEKLVAALKNNLLRRKNIRKNS